MISGIRSLMAIMVSIIAFVTAGKSAGKQEAESCIYPKTAIVIEISGLCVKVEDYSGNDWVFESESYQWYEGDLVSMIMDDNGTPDNNEDDRIVTVSYGGWIGHYGEGK